MPSNAAIFIVLLAGFLFLRVFPPTRYVSQRWSGPRLVFGAGTAGAFLLIVSRIVGYYLPSWVWIERSELWLQGIAGQAVPYLGTMVGTLALSLILALAGGLIIGTTRATLTTNRWFGNSFLRLLTEQFGTKRMVAVTLSNGKVYVGLIVELPTLDPNEQYLKMLPALSGYRDEEGGINFTTNYYDTVLVDIGKKGTILESYREEDFQIVIRMDTVETLRVFDPEIYDEYFREKGAAADSGHQEEEGHSAGVSGHGGESA